MAGDITPFAAPEDLHWAVSGGAVRRERTGGGVMAILPELRPTLVVMLGDPHFLRAAEPGAAWACVPDAAVWGPALHARRGWTAGDVRAIGFGLTAQGVRALCGVPPGRLFDRTVGLGEAGEAFAAACRVAWTGERPDLDAVLAALRRLLGAGPDAALPAPLMLDPDAPIAAQARAAGLSDRQFRRRFAAEWGAAPKVWQRLARVDAMLAALGAGRQGRSGGALRRRAAPDPGISPADRLHAARLSSGRRGQRHADLAQPAAAGRGPARACCATGRLRLASAPAGALCSASLGNGRVAQRKSTTLTR